MSEVEITYGEAKAAHRALVDLRSTKIKKGISLKFVMAIKRAVDALAIEATRADEILREVVDKYVERDDDGNPVVLENGNSKIREDDVQEYVKDVDEILSDKFKFSAVIPFVLVSEFLDSLSPEDGGFDVGFVASLVPIIGEEE